MLAIPDHLRISRHIADIDRYAAESGLHLHLSGDFREFRDIRQAMTDRTPMTPIFDPSTTDIGPSNGFWIKGTDAQGKLLHLQATRCNNLQGVCLGDHLYELRRLYRLPGLNMETDVERDSLRAPALSRISGSVCYHGEIWLDETLRGKGLSAVLPRFLLALALIKWAPDFIFGFVPTKLAYRGIQAQYGYMHVEPGGILGKKSNKAEPINKWLVWLSHEDLNHLTLFESGLGY